MSLRVGSIIAFGVIAMASPVAGQGKESGDITVTARDQEAEEQVVVCKYQANTGTRFKTKNCRTKLQWEQLPDGLRIVCPKDIPGKFAVGFRVGM